MSDEEIMERLTWLRICGPEGAHTRQNNLESIARLRRGDPYVTLGIRAVEEAVREDEPWTTTALLDAVASVTGCAKDPRHNVGMGYISPRATLRGLRECRARARGSPTWGQHRLWHRPCRLPDLLLSVDCRGRPRAGRHDRPRRWGYEIQSWEFIDWVGDVCAVSNGSGLIHTHTQRAMEIITDWGVPIDLAVTDHRLPGPALNAGIPTVAFRHQRSSPGSGPPPGTDVTSCR